MFVKMRKNLGNKRKEISPKNLIDIVKTYASFESTETSKIFKTTDFGYRQITVERPLKLSFKIDDETIENAMLDKNVLKLSQEERNKLAQALRRMKLEFTSRADFLETLSTEVKKLDLKLSAQLAKSLVGELSFRSEEAEVCLDAKGRIEPDADARDTENIPLDEDVAEYFAREVAPFAPDAWIDPVKEKIGYEIPFTRHFFNYVPPRPLAEIDIELNELVAEIQGLLKEIEK
jgi:type I restriction enzyme M protein